MQLPATGEDAALIALDSLDGRARLLELGFARVDLRDPEAVLVRPRSVGDEARVRGGGYRRRPRRVEARSVSRGRVSHGA